MSLVASSEIGKSTESENGTKTAIKDKKTQPEGFRFFKKECSLVTTVVVRAYENGKFVGFVLVDRGRPPLGPALPGGFVEYGETPENCAKRTLFDECGISSVSSIQQFQVFSDPNRDPRTHAVDIAYVVRIDDQKLSSGTDAKHAWICPIESIPWDKLNFDHKDMLKAYLECTMASQEGWKPSQKIQLGSMKASKARNKNEFENIAKQAYRPPHLFVSGIIEVYENNEFKGFAIAELPSKKDIKLLPGGHVAYGETIEQSFQRHMKQKYQANIAILCPFKTYSFFNENNKKHDITTVFLAKADKKDLGSLSFYALENISMEDLGFHHKDILEDYLKYRRNESVDTCVACIPFKIEQR